MDLPLDLFYFSLYPRQCFSFSTSQAQIFLSSTHIFCSINNMWLVTCYLYRGVYGASFIGPIENHRILSPRLLSGVLGHKFEVPIDRFQILPCSIIIITDSLYKLKMFALQASTKVCHAISLAISRKILYSLTSPLNLGNFNLVFAFLNYTQATHANRYHCSRLN